MSAPCKVCGTAEGWYTSWSGGFAHPLPCPNCNPHGQSREAFTKARGNQPLINEKDA